jgi:hypothetical protein
MIELAHAASGALVGRACDGPLDALIAGMAVHALGDVVPHGEINDTQFEVKTAIASIALLALRYGPGSPVVWGAVGGVLPDAEHVLPTSIKPERAMFPTHRYESLHASDGALAIPAWLQAIIGGAIVGALLMLRRRLPALDEF